MTGLGTETASAHGFRSHKETVPRKTPTVRFPFFLPARERGLSCMPGFKSLPFKLLKQGGKWIKLIKWNLKNKRNLSRKKEKWRRQGSTQWFRQNRSFRNEKNPTRQISPR